MIYLLYFQQKLKFYLFFINSLFLKEEFSDMVDDIDTQKKDCKTSWCSSQFWKFVISKCLIKTYESNGKGVEMFPVSKKEIDLYNKLKMGDNQKSSISIRKNSINGANTRWTVFPKCVSSLLVANVIFWLCMTTSRRLEA